ncbi:MAG TPA: 50S ribosomal protein L25 [Candidatus Methylomirabilis sp.]|nr:50S ribosomal protein L25 [Candidatus Methylomirabilis sp.]
MEFVDLKVERRTGTGKSVARRLRQQGRIPAIVYGEGEPIPVAADPKSLLKALRTEAGENVILNLTIVDTDEVTRKAMVKGVQVDPVSGIVLHADFLAISMERPIEVGVPVDLMGVARGVKEEGGIVEQILRELKVKCLPSAIPDRIQLDISTLSMGDVVHVKDLAIPGGVELLTDREQVVVTVAAAPVEEVAVPVAAEAVAPEAAEAPAEEGAAKEAAKPGAAKAAGKPGVAKEAAKPGAAPEAPGKPSAKGRPEKE